MSIIKSKKTKGYRSERFFRVSGWQYVIIHCLSLSIWLSGCDARRNSEQSKEKHIANEKKKATTKTSKVSPSVKIVPTMNVPFNDNNTVHCANVEYLWNVIQTNADKQIHENSFRQELNKSKTWRNSMDTSRLVLAFGSPNEVYESLIRQYKEKYKIDRTDLSPQGDTFWGYTDKIINARYTEPFEKQELVFLTTNVAAFGFSSGFSSSYAKEHFRNQFDILYYDENGEFIVKLNPAYTTDEIILSRIDKDDTFLQMFKKSQQRIKEGERKIKQNPTIYSLNAEDELIIPVINFKASKEYPELKGLQFSSRYGPIDAFNQNIQFIFDEKGVAMESTVAVSDSVGKPQKPKILHYNRPFYLYIKEASAPYPYFNLWVSDIDILEKTK